MAWSPSAYFSDSWNILDFAIVMVSLLSLLVFALPELESLMAIRVLRVLRPLRLLARNEGTRLVMTVLFTSFPIVSAILAVVIFVMTVFASGPLRGAQTLFMRHSNPTQALGASTPHPGAHRNPATSLLLSSVVPGHRGYRRPICEE